MSSSELSDLSCGSFSGRFSYYLDMFSGSGSSISQFRENPVFCCEGEKSQIIMGISMPIEFKLSGYEDILNDEISSLVGSVGADTLKIIYPESSITAGQTGGIRDMEYYFNSKKRWSCGISFWRPFGVAGEFTANSIEMTMKTDAGFREQTTLIVLGNDIVSDLEINLDQSRIAWGWNFPAGLNAAIGIDIYHISANLEASSRTEGFIRQYGEDTDIIQSFNNPTDSQYFRNTLDNFWSADFDDNLTGVNSGISYRLNDDILLDLGYTQSLKENLSGNMNGIVHQLGAVDYEALTGDSDGELFDELLLEPSKMTYTNQTEYICENLTMSYPGAIRLGAMLVQGSTKQQFTLTTYTGELSFRYQGMVIDRGREKLESGFGDYERSSDSDYKYGISLNSKIEYSMTKQFKNNLGIFFNLQYLSFDEVLDNIKDSSGNPVQPDKAKDFFSISGGFSYYFSENLWWDIRMLGFPGTFLDSRLTYRFGSE